MSDSPPDILDPIWCLWGKAQRAGGDSGPAWHPLVCHLLDVMNVADALIDRLPKAARDVILGPLGGDASGRPWLRFLVAMHDAGKLTPGFQGKADVIRDLQARVGLICIKEECHKHGVTGTVILSELLQDERLLGRVALPSSTALALARAVTSHHGEFVLDKLVRQCARHLPKQGPTGAWTSIHRELARLILECAVGELELTPLSPEIELNPGFMLALTGLTSVSDWLGSDTSVFNYEKTPLKVNEYLELSRTRAASILDRVGWFQRFAHEPRSFRELFPFEARSLQLQTEAAISELSAPSLIIIESTMGDGKTEAALLVSELLGPRIGQGGMYIGLPTQATANQMLGRVRRFLERTHQEETNLQLVHGDAVLSRHFQELKLRAIYGDSEASVSAQVWFTQSKRALLASHAVGTIDQSLLGVLQTRHGFVRLFGLLGKTVVLDEVHAYDTYTSELLDRLVEWLSVLGATVVVLSATLPKERRLKLINAYGATAPEIEVPYPRITAAMRGSTAISVKTEPSRPPQEVHVLQRDSDLAILSLDVANAVANGGVAAWICNTVHRSQEVFAMLRSMKEQGALPSDVVLGLFHSRFLRKDRQRIEQWVERLYGPIGDAESVRKSVFLDEFV